MDQNSNDLKVSVNSDKPLRKVRKTTTAKEKTEQTEKPKSKSEKSSMMSTAISVIITALVVGGGIYFWQGDKVQQTVDGITSDFRNQRNDLEKKLSNISDKAQGLETQVGELQTKNEKLAETEKLLADAKIEFSNSELGLKFDYPATLGEVKVTIENGEGGKTIKGTFSKNDKLTFGGVSKNYKQATTSTTTAITDFEGYKEKDKKFFFLAPSNNTDGYEMASAGDINTGKGKAFLLNSKSFKPKTASSTELTVNIGGDLAAVVNITNQDFGGVVFVNSDFGLMPVDGFKKMIGSIK